VERKFTYSAADVGINAATLDAAVTGNYLYFGDAREMCLLVFVDYTAVTEIQIELDWRANKGDTLNYEMAGTSTAQDSTDTVSTIKPMKYKLPTQSADIYAALVIPVYNMFGRIRVTDTGGGVADKVTIQVTALK